MHKKLFFQVLQTLERLGQGVKISQTEKPEQENPKREENPALA